MFEFISGPLVWIAFAVCIGGSIYKIANMLKMAKAEKVIYPYMKVQFSLRSLARWIVPYGSRSMRINTLMTAVAYSFHLCLLITPLLLMAHQKMWGIRILTLPGWLADLMTLVVIIGGFWFIQRRLLVPYVKNVTQITDYALLLCVITPYITGFLAYHHWFNYDAVITVHVLSGCLMLMIIPFTRIAHMLYFVFTRAYMACEFGYVRHARDW